MTFYGTLFAWYEENKRSLPWRGETDPYKIWVSEIILQQTRVQQGWNYYLRFIEAFPNVQTLAKASEEQVLRLWQGLGYYSRARNMHHAAQQLLSKHNGIFPNNYESIRNLKGIGDYTAAAISTIAFGLPYPAVDGNVMRIISRIFGICEEISLPATKKKITELCTQNMPADNAGTFNQACMDFGSLVCTPRNPQCKACPFHKDCYALNHQLVEVLPAKSKSIEKKKRYFHLFFYIYNNSTIVEKRVHKDIWQNMYQFPLEENQEDTDLRGEKSVYTIQEILSHQIIKARFYVKEVKKLPKIKGNQQIVSICEVEKYPFPKIMTQFLSHCDIKNHI